MRRDLLEALTLAAMFGGQPSEKRKIRVVDNPEYTRNMFGSISEIAGKELELLERNPEGDCLCIFTGIKGPNIVDVDHRDVSRKASSVSEATKSDSASGVSGEAEKGNQ